MSNTRLPAQLQTFSLAGSGASATDTTIILQSMTDIDGNPLEMSSLGTKAYGTLEPNNSTQEEQISFTGINQNGDGTATLTGVSNVGFLSPYTETSGLAKSHPGGSQFIISNTSAFYWNFANTEDQETISEVWTFDSGATPTIADQPVNNIDAANKLYVDTVAIQGAPNATTSIQGLVQLGTQAQVDAHTGVGSTTASLVATPANLRSTNINDYVLATGSANAYAITPPVTTTAYAAGQRFTFKANFTNTGSATLNVDTLGATTIKKNGGQFDLVAGDIKNGAIVEVEYDGTNMSMLSASSLAKTSQSGTEIYAASTTGTTAYAVALVPALSAYAAGLVVNFKPDTGGGHATLNVNSLGAKNIYKTPSLPVSAGDIVANQMVSVMYDGIQFQLISKPNVGLSYKAGVTTKDLSNTGNTVIPHGLGTTPNRIRLTGYLGATSSSLTNVTTGTYDGSTNNVVASNGVATQDFNSSSYAIYFRPSNNVTENSMKGVATVDATNITITWTQTNSPTGTAQILWEAFVNN